MSLIYPADLDSNSESHRFIIKMYGDTSASLSEGKDGTDASSQEVTEAEEGSESSKVGGGAGSAGSTEGGRLGQSFKETKYNKSEDGPTAIIHLPFPHSISIGDAWNWETVSTRRTILGDLVTGNDTAALERGISTVGGGIGKIFTENADRLVAHERRWSVNPRKETMFQEPEQRGFSFLWELAPRNQKDSDAINKIVRLLKYNAAPEMYSDEHALYQYPSEFQPLFYSDGKENDYIGKIARCCVTKVSTEYAGAGIWSAFESTNAPTALKLTIDFRELSLLSRADLKKMDEATR